MNIKDDKLDKSKRILKLYHQEHLLDFYDEISEEQKEILLNQILSIDFEQIFSLYDNSMTNNFALTQKLTPLEYVKKEDLSDKEILFYTTIGNKILNKNQFAVVTMAGGQGSRLGYKGPKGTYMLDLKPYRKSLFQIMCEDLKRANEQYHVVIPWFIMTSDENDSATKTFFMDNDFFGYPQNSIFFFTQGKLPVISVNRQLLLQEPYFIREGANGNGNVFVSMKNHGILEHMEKLGIQWISFGGIDNVLLKNVDTLLLGLVIDANEKIASKSIFKKLPLEKTAVYCRKDGKPSILDYDDISLEISESKDYKGNYLYRDANMLSHLMHIDAIKKVSTIQLPYHRAYKKNAFVNEEGVKQVPDRPNSFKFENFIFDAFQYFDNMLLLRVNEEDEFAPIKDFTGIYNPDTAKEKYLNFWRKNFN